MPVDPSARIAPTARVDPDAVVGAQTVIQDYCVVERDVIIGPHCLLEPYVFVKRWTTLGERNEISACTVLGSDPLDKGFTGERSYLVIGKSNKIREHYTISRGTKPESETVIGNGNYIMTAGHIAHNCRIGNDCVIASTSLVAGYCEIEDQVFISGGNGIHQYSRIGRLAMVAGMTRVNMDLPPFLIFSGYKVGATGLNLVGLRRAGFDREQIRVVKQTYQVLFHSGLKMEDALRKVEAEIDSEHARQVVEFIRKSKRPVARSRRAGMRDEESE
ncbi:MAG TPA: acyl-ACP--UDP-N-acetylglucosamine O-acyltransferase [Bryobacteraceae bacterium]|jgi:UDP-N-acetylglucosamine acyltransferase